MYRNCFLIKKKGKTGVLFFGWTLCVCVITIIIITYRQPMALLLVQFTRILLSHFFKAVDTGISTAYRFLRVRACIDIGMEFFDPVTRNFGFPGVSKCFSVEMSTTYFFLSPVWEELINTGPSHIFLTVFIFSRTWNNPANNSKFPTNKSIF